MSQVSGFTLWAVGFGFKVFGFRFYVFDFRLKVLYQVWGFRFRVPFRQAFVLACLIRVAKQTNYKLYIYNTLDSTQYTMYYKDQNLVHPKQAQEEDLF